MDRLKALFTAMLLVALATPAFASGGVDTSRAYFSGWGIFLMVMVSMAIVWIQLKPAVKELIEGIKQEMKSQD